MSAIKPGQRLKSSTCDTEVMVIKYAGGAELSCGGALMADTKEALERSEPDPDLSGGTQIGKRYVNEEGSIELLCVKAGAGSLAADGTPMAIKESKPLPSSD